MIKNTFESVLDATEDKQTPKTLKSTLSKLELDIDRFRIKSGQLLIRVYFFQLTHRRQSNCREFFCKFFLTTSRPLKEKKKKTCDTQVHWEKQDQ
jgi:hypothetical protein